MNELEMRLSVFLEGGLRDYQVDRAAFTNFTRRYRDPRSFMHAGKFLEYFLSEQFHQFEPDQAYIDIACQDCPFAKYVRKQYLARAYRQDLYHLPSGIHEWDIGGQASELPFADGQVAGLSLHNSIEHFEGDSDTAFIREAQRVLRATGQLVVAPLYIALEPAEQHDAGWTDECGVKHLWGVGAQFARMYSPKTLAERVFDAAPGLCPAVYRVFGVEAAGRSTFYLLVMTKR